MKRQKDEPGSSTEKCHESYRQSQNTSSTQKSLGAARCRAGKGAEGEKEIARTPIRPSFLTHGWGPNLSAGNVAKIANLTSRDLYGQGPCPPDRTRREMPGKVVAIQHYLVISVVNSYAIGIKKKLAIYIADTAASFVGCHGAVSNGNRRR